MRNRDTSFVLASHQMRREQYLRYYRETESEADILVDQSEDKFKVKTNKVKTNIMNII